MYETDELIDEIRRLEKATENVYIVLVSGTNYDGDAGVLLGPVYNYFPDWEEVKEDIEQHAVQWADYDYFVERWHDNHYGSWGDCEYEDHEEGTLCEENDCDGTQCCDAWKNEPERCKPQSKEEFVKESVSLRFASYAQSHMETYRERLVVSPDASVFIYLGEFTDSDSEWSGEIHIRSAKVKKMRSD